MTDENTESQDAGTRVSETVTDIVGSTARHVITPLKTGGGKK